MNPSDPLLRILYDAVDGAVRSVAPSLSEAERAAMVEHHVRQALPPEEPVTMTPREAAHAVATAKRHLAAARDQLAQAPVREMPPVLVDADWEELESAMESNRERLLSFRGVVGFGLAPRIRGGMETDEPAVVVYVRRKQALKDLDPGRHLPTEIEGPRGQRVPVDVVEVGGLKRQLLCGASIGHAEAGLKHRWATVGLIARDDFTGQPVAITAMHLTGLKRDFPPGTPLKFLTPDASRPGSRPLGVLLKGTRRGVDAAKISIIDPSGLPSPPFVEGIGEVKGTRVLSHPGDRKMPVQLFGARSGYREGLVDTPLVELPQFGLGKCILISTACKEGDSGAAVLDMDRRVIGTLVGALRSRPHIHVVNPIGAVLNALNCSL